MSTTRIRNIAITCIRTASDPQITPYVELSGKQLKNRLNPNDALVILESLNVLRFALESGVKLVSVLVDHVFLCIKDAGEFLYMLKLKISFIWLGSESDSLVS